MKTPVFLVASSPAALAAALAPFASTATVEAEYGDAVVPGTLLTMAHHGPRAGGRAPCAYSNHPIGEVCTACDGRGQDCRFCDGAGEVPAYIGAVGLSHVDLDSLGGCAAILGRKPHVRGFWDLAEFIDLRGAHRLGESGASPENVRRLNAFWAWSKEHRVLVPREGHADVTTDILAGCAAVEAILADDPAMLAAGDAFAAGEAKLNAASFVEAKGGVITRRASGFVNHLYADPSGQPGVAVVALNTTTGAVTVSFAGETPPGGAVAIVQGLWGPLAGGHLGIAGSPRGEKFGEAELGAAVAATRRAILTATTT